MPPEKVQAQVPELRVHLLLARRHSSHSIFTTTTATRTTPSSYLHICEDRKKEAGVRTNGLEILRGLLLLLPQQLEGQRAEPPPPGRCRPPAPPRNPEQQ